MTHTSFCQEGTAENEETDRNELRAGRTGRLARIEAWHAPIPRSNAGYVSIQIENGSNGKCAPSSGIEGKPDV